jgi:hypothetical protein
MLALVLLLIGGIAALTHTAPFPFLLEAFHPRQSLWRVEPVKGAPPTIHLTFDDGPNADCTPAAAARCSPRRTRLPPTSGGGPIGLRP